VTRARIEARFAALAREDRAGFVAYVMAGDPDAATSVAILRALAGAGADILEVGFPFSDPMAEGPTIQRASARALAAGMTLDGALGVVRAFRETDAATPVVLMGYLNPLLAKGLEAFAREAGRSGADGVIVVDCPPEEAGPLQRALEPERLALIRLATPTSDAARLKVIAAGAAGFIYYVSVTGVTGVKAADPDAIAPAVEAARRASGMPVAVGFGVREPAQAARVARFADAVVVGSALVDAVEAALAQTRDPVAKVVETAAALVKSVRSARREPI
jgi:tryptophan synthase alpha chain